MQNFKLGDPVFILPKFSHLFPGNSGIVRDVKINRTRPLLTAYDIEFPNGSTETLFEFQIIEDIPGYTTVFATLTFDSDHEVPTGIRGSQAARRIILQTAEFSLDMRIRTTKSRLSIIGQILERGTSELLKHVKVNLLKDTMSMDATTSDETGVFTFNSAPRGSLNILIIVPERKFRIVAPFSV